MAITQTMLELKKKIYIKAKAEKPHSFWGVYVHLCKLTTLEEVYRAAKKNNGEPGIDGMTFEDIQQSGGVESFINNIQQELISETYRPSKNRIKEIPKADGKTRKLGIPTIRDRVVQAALKLIMELVSEADFQDGSYGYRPKRTAHQAIERVAEAVVKEKTKELDFTKGDRFGFLGFDFRRMKTKTKKCRVDYKPKMQARSKVIDKIRDVFRRHGSQPLTWERDLINPILRGWVQYFKVGNSSKTFTYVKDCLTKKIMRDLMKAKRKQGFGWMRWSTKGLYTMYNIYKDFKLSQRKVAPT